MTTLTQTVEVSYQSTSNPLIANQWLTSITAPIIACDFETASRYTDSDKEELKALLSTLQEGSLDYHLVCQQIASDGLSHPSLSRLTHFSLAISESFAYVFIIDSQRMHDLILSWLTRTPITQVWHNASFDFRHIYYHTNKFPINYQDSQVLSKTILNHVNNQRSQTGLKHLMGYKYGGWAISADNFHLSQMYEPHVLHYAATDACATFALWQELQDYIKED